ncbi:MAG TPA: DsbA family protein [Aestuariivirga sp.]|jgi:protein-disulfide isomerase|nr:DsbA family protein [Aestuariivirga sp.]HQY73770.1 DsbA family protein [Aestuariivirga sp.]HRA95062.1 DsbA family protein [Aestuariivirga sp.]
MIKLNKRHVLFGSAALAGLALGGASAFAQNLAGLNDPPAFGEMTLGPDTAKVTVIEYASATCPHCAAFHNETFEALKKEYIDTGKIKFVFREFPHQDAALAAFMLARCAPKEKYFPLIDVFFATQPEWTQNPLEGLNKIAQQAGFTKESFDACMKNETVAKDILAVRSKAEGFGVTGIPTFFVNGERFEGETTIEAFRAKIDPLLT